MNSGIKKTGKEFRFHECQNTDSRWTTLDEWLDRLHDNRRADNDISAGIDIVASDAKEDATSDTTVDASPYDDTNDSVEDTTYEPGPGQTGWPCTSEDECDSGFCLGLEEDETGYCSDICQQECPTGFLCKNQPQYGPVVFLCVEIEEVGCIKQCTHPIPSRDAAYQEHYVPMSMA